MFAKGQVVTVTRMLAGSDLIVDAAATDTVLFVDDVSTFDEAGGMVDVAGTVYGYDSIDTDANTITLSSGLTDAALAFDTFVAVSPSGPIQTAEVVFADGSGVTVPALVPQYLRALLHEGVREPDEREAVTIVNTGDDWLIFDIEFRAGQHDATTTPIIVTTEDGESVRIDGDGVSTFTDNPVPIRTIPAAVLGGIAADGSYVYKGGVVRKYDVATGVQITSGFPLAGTFKAYTLAADGSNLFAVDTSTDDIRKFNASTGAESLSGFPIAGTFKDALTSDGTNLFAIDAGTSDIRKFDATTGVENLSGFPIAGTFKWGLTIDGTDLFAIDSASDIRKYDMVTGVENTSGFPIAGSFSFVASNGAGHLYAIDSSDLNIHKYDAETGVEVTDGGFPITGPFPWGLAVDDARIYAVSYYGNIRIFNGVSGYESTHTDSTDGTYLGHAVLVSDIVAAGDAIIGGAAQIDNLIVTTTKMTRAAAQNATSGAQVVVDFDTFEGSGTSGATAFYSESGGTVTIADRGVYDIAALPIVAANINGLRRVRILINGSAYLDYLTDSVSGSVTWKFPLAIPKIPLAAGDTIQLEIQQTSGSTLSLAGSWLSIARAGVLAA